MPTKKVRYTQPLLGEANAAGYLIAVPGASVLIRQDGVECDVFADNDGTAMTNPVPTGVPVGTAGVDVRGTLLVYLEPGSGYDAVATVGNEASTFPIPDISPDVADVQAPIPSGTYVQPGENLADLSDTVEARTNLGLGTAALREATEFVPEVTGARTGDVAGVLGQLPVDARPRFRPNPAVLTPTITDATFRNPIWLSDDGVTLFLTAGTELRTSTDDGATSALLYTFPKNVYTVRQMANGELIVGLYDAGLTPGELWVSDGYPGAATWTKSKTASAAHVYFETSWGISVHGGAKVLAGEYGTKMPTAPSAPRYVYLSEDYGLTWSTIYDTGNVADSHIHGVAYDVWWDRIWVTIGDDAAAKIIYSDDLGDTWSTVEGSVGAMQSTAIAPMPGCVLFLTDGGPNGVRRVVRKNKTETPVVEMAFTYTQEAIISWIGTQAYRRPDDPDAPLLLPFVVSGLMGAMPGTLLVTYDGFDFVEVFRDAQSYTATGSGLVTAMGPTASGKIVGLLNDDRNVSTSGSRLVAPAPAKRTMTTAANGLTGLWLPGVVGNYLSTPDAAGLGLTGDLDLRVLLEASSWTGTMGLVSKWADVNGERSYLLALIGGSLYLLWSADGTAQLQATFSMASVPLDTPVWLRGTLVSNDGAGNRRATLEWRYVDADASWTVLVNQVTAGTTAVFDSPHDVQVGAWGAAGNQPLLATLYQAEIRSGRYGSIVGGVDCRNAWNDRYRDRQGNVWTLNGAGWAWTTSRLAAA